MLQRAPMADSSRTMTAGALAGFADARSLRAQLSPVLFRGMLTSMAAACVALHRITGDQQLAWRFAKARARDLERLLGVRVTVTGLEHVACGGPFVFAPNHQSHLDILALLAHLPGATRFAAKRSLWKYAVVGAVLDALGMVPIDREDPAQAIAALNAVEARDQSIVVFPEGTRSRDGQLGAFKKGAFVLALRLGIPIVPVVCIGTRRLMPKGSRLVVVPGDVHIVVERPIPTAGLGADARDRLAGEVRAAIARHHTGW
jgi:1-acyl-sn-glycerol-3-phosphate acyltransferase